MSISAIKRWPPSRRRMLRAAVTGASVALFCVIFTFVYEQFSHGAVSSHMRCMFLMPLVGCALPSLIGLLPPLHRFVSRAGFNLWNSGLAVWTVGCLFRGIVNISGRYTDLDQIYWAGGWVFLGLAVLAHTVSLILSHRPSKEDPCHE